MPRRDADKELKAWLNKVGHIGEEYLSFFEAKSYPWNKCIRDQMKRYGNKKTAEKVCGYIRAKYGKHEDAPDDIEKEVYECVEDGYVGKFEEVSDHIYNIHVKGKKKEEELTCENCGSSDNVHLDPHTDKALCRECYNIVRGRYEEEEAEPKVKHQTVDKSALENLLHDDSIQVLSWVPVGESSYKISWRDKTPETSVLSHPRREDEETTKKEAALVIETWDSLNQLIKDTVNAVYKAESNLTQPAFTPATLAPPRAQPVPEAMVDTVINVPKDEYPTFPKSMFFGPDFDKIGDIVKDFRKYLIDIGYNNPEILKQWLEHAKKAGADWM
jgi:ribosomal protein S17E